MNKLKAGLILDSMSPPAWIARAIELILRSEFAGVTLVLINGAPKPVALPFFYAAYKKYDAKKTLKAPDALKSTDVSGVLSGIPQRRAADMNGGEQPVDILINFSGSPIPPGMGRLSANGTWSHFFGNATNEAAHGIWEVLNESVITSGLLCETSTGRRDVVYQSYGLVDPVSLKRTLNRCYWKSASFAARMLKKLALQRSVTPVQTEFAMMKARALPPSDISFLYAFLKNTARRIVNKLGRLSVKRDWALMYDTNSYAGKPFSAGDFKTLTPPAGFFWADPVVIEREGRFYLFIEEYVYAENKARIIVTETGNRGNFSAPQVVLDKPYHLSYPFVFEHEGKHYMIPESSDNGTVELYESTDFPYKWTLKRNLLENIIAVDTTVLYRDKKWWLFMNVEENKGAASMDELYLFYTDDIFNSKLVSHPQNPVMSDVRNARPAGPVYAKDGELFRPSQICSPHYGWGICISKITSLTVQDYREEPFTRISPDAGSGIAGIHTITYAGNLCVVDALLDVKK